MRPPELQVRFDQILLARSEPERVLDLLADYPDDDDGDAMALGADALMQLRRYEEALDVWRALDAANPGDPRAAVGLAALGAAPPLGRAGAIPFELLAQAPAPAAPSAPVAPDPIPPSTLAAAAAPPPAPKPAPATRKAAPAPAPAVAAAPAAIEAPKPRVSATKLKIETTTAVVAVLSLALILAGAFVWFFTLVSILAVVVPVLLGIAGAGVTAGLVMRQPWGQIAALSFAGATALAGLAFALLGPLFGASFVAGLASGGVLFLAAAGLGVLSWSERAKAARTAGAAARAA